jgi:hypothetical protein
MKFICCLFLVICLTACESPLITDLVAGPGGTLFHDDFSDPASGWERISGQGGAMDYDNGMYRMVVTAQHYDLWSFSGHSYRDVRVEVDATWMAGPVENLFGLTCRSRNDNDFYFFAISSDGYYAIGKMKNGTTSLLGQEMMAHSTAIIQSDDPNHLRFDCIGQTLTGYVNGQAVAITNDADFLSGDAGLIVGTFDQPGVDVAFDNFVVTKP